MTTGKELYRLVVEKENGKSNSADKNLPWDFLSWLSEKQKGTDPTPGSINSKAYGIAEGIFNDQKETLIEIDSDFEEGMEFIEWMIGYRGAQGAKSKLGEDFGKSFSQNIDRVFTVEYIFGGCGLEDFNAIYDPLLLAQSPATLNLIGVFTSGSSIDNVGNDSRAVEVNFNPCSTSETNLDAYLEILVAEIYENAGFTAIFKQAEEEERSGLAGIINRRFGDGTLSEELLSEIAEKQERFRDSIYFKNVRFKEQCFLLSNVQALARIKKQIDIGSTTNIEGEPVRDPLFQIYHRKQLPSESASGNRTLLLQGDPYALMNRLTQSGKKEAFFDISNAALSSLQPMTRLYKVVYDTGSQTEREIEIEFDSNTTQKDLSLLEDIRKRGHGVGIKSFSFSYDGDNPFAIKKSIKATLVIVANTFGELLRKRGEYSYIDLALKTGGEETVNSLDPLSADEKLTSNLQKLNFRLKAIVGWANPISVDGTVITDDIKSAVYDSYITLNLTPTVHDFKFEETGKVTFTQEYFAYVEDFFDEKSFDIFSNPDIATGSVSQTLRKIEYANEIKKCSAVENISEIRNANAEVIEQEKIINRRSLMLDMIEKEKIRVVNIPINTMDLYRRNGPLSDSSEQLEKAFAEVTVQSLSPSTPDSLTSTLFTEADTDEEKVTVATPNTFPVETVFSTSFFWVSDLLDVILERIGKTLDLTVQELEKEAPEGLEEAYAIEIENYKRYLENFKRLRIMLGPVELLNANKTGAAITTEFVNFGDLPISVKYFMEFLTEKYLKKEREIYPLNTFLNQFFNELIGTFLNKDTCYSNRARQKTRLGSAALTAYNNYDDVDDITYLCKKRKTTRLPIQAFSMPILNVMGGRDEATNNPGIDKEINYLVYYAARTQPTEIMRGVKSEDHPKGIWHYQVGKDRGIVKTIDLTKTTSTGLAEVRFEQEGYDGLSQLRVLYDVTIKTFLDVSAFPGNYIYVEPRGFDPSLDQNLTRLGVGGYCMIISSDHTIGPGLAETTINAKWVAQAEAEELASNQNSEADKGSEEPDVSKCSDLLGRLEALNKDLEQQNALIPDDVNGDDGSSGDENDVPIQPLLPGRKF